MKKVIFLSIFWLIFPFFSFAEENFSEYLWADKWDAISNIYANTYKYYEKNLWIWSNDAIEYIASKLWTDYMYIKYILDWELTLCSKFFNKLNIKIPKNWATKENFEACYNKISNMYSNYVQTYLTNKEIEDTLSVENLLTDWKDSNSPYDLLVDIQDLGNLLFKKKVNIHFWNILIWNKKWWINNDPKYNWLIPYDDMIIKDDTKNDTNKNNKNNDKNNNDSNKNSKPLNEKTDPNSPINKIKKITNNQNNLQIWNMCLNTDNNLNNNSNNSSNNNKNNNWFWNTYNPDIWANNNYNDTKFETFIWKNIPWWDFNLWDVLDWWENKNVEWALKWWSSLCSWKDKILTICLKFVPSWPRWSAWWTTSKNTLEWIITQIMNTLKDLRSSFFIAAWHWDEALDIDFKHVKLADIFTFNIILSPKPVFRFTKDRKAEKKENEADTELCKQVPKKLSVLYNETAIAYCNTKSVDQNKYLITNLETAGIQAQKPEKLTKPDDKVINNTAKWSYKEIELYTQYNENLLKFMTNIEWLMERWVKVSAVLKAKSE